MKKPVVIIAIILAAAGLGAAAYYWQHLREAGPALRSPPRDIGWLLEKPAGPPAGKWDEINSAPLKLPAGFSLAVFAGNLPGARALALDPGGILLVSLPAQGRVVALPDRDDAGVAPEAVTVLEGLNRPHGLAFDNSDPPRLYVAETHQVAVYDYDAEKLTAHHPRKIIDLPDGGRDRTRTLLFMPPPDNHRLLMAVGSSCDACEEQDHRYAKIHIADASGSNLETFASGLRQPGFMAVHPVTGHIWATERSREDPTDNPPPDEINIILEGCHYGWPYCYGKRIYDEKFDPACVRTDFCLETVPSFIDLPPRAAPEGLAFFPGEWPRAYRYHLLVAFHGDEKHVPPKVVRFKLDAEGIYLGEEDFITGWLAPDGTVLGRPADILIQPDGVIVIADDKAGVIYRVVLKK